MRTNNLLAVLLRHELRLTWRATGLAARVRRRPWVTAALTILGVGLMHALAWVFLQIVPLSAPVAPIGRNLVAAATLLVASLLLMSALSHSVEALFERRDLDLLFSAPVPPAAVLAVRTLAVAAQTLLVHALYLLPFANMAMVTGRTWLRGLYLLVPLAALLGAAIGVMLALILVRRIGARRTRMWVQIVGVCAGAAGYVGSQLASRPHQFGGSGFRGGLIQGLGAFAPARDAIVGAITGDAAALGALATVTVVVCALTWRRLDHVFLRGSQESMTSGAPAALAPRKPLTASPIRHWRVAVWRKEWRLIRRDPMLLARLSASLFYILPILGLALREDMDVGVRAAFAAGATVFIAANLAHVLAVLTVCMEDAPDLVLAAPRSLAALLEAKAWAAIIVATLSATALLAAVAPFFGAAVLLAAPFTLLAAVTAALLCAARPRLLPRSQFGRRRQGAVGFWAGLVLVVIAGINALAAGCLVVGWIAASLFLAAPSVAIIVWQRRRMATTRVDQLIAVDGGVGAGA